MCGRERQGQQLEGNRQKSEMIQGISQENPSGNSAQNKGIEKQDPNTTGYRQ